jgi:hypothetical protein
MICKIACRCVVMGLVGALVGCAPKGTRQNSNPTYRGIVVSPLSVQVDDPKLLLSVNSVLIEKPAFQGAVHSNASEEGLLVVVREVAEETLSMKVVGPSKNAGGKGQADSVLRTDIVTMDDLKGSSVGGEPARVAFRMGIYAGTDQRPVWQANYVYQQEAMADNWLKLGDRLGRDGSGAGWITAQEIFKRGVTQSLEDFNRRRDSQFQGVRPVK